MPEAPILSAAPGQAPAPIAPVGSAQTELPLEPDPIAPSQADPALQTPPTGQLLLGTDKRNPVFAVYQDDSGERLLVYYGFELIEIVNNDSADPSFKLLLARLYNARIKLSTLCQTFQVDPKTIRRWGKALLQGDAAQLVRVLEGRGVCHKLTPAVENFARLRWPHLVAERRYGAVGRLLVEIQSVFTLEISRSGLQGLIRVLKGGTAPEESSLPQEDPPSSLASPDIHTVQGAPIYFETTDNFVDLRQRFCGVIGRARQALQWPADIVPTSVVDRGCYGGEFFEKVTDDPTFHLITWEKGCRAEAWDPAKVMGQTTITRCRNDATDVRVYHFEYVERAWEKNPLLRKIVVRATDDKGRTILVAILTDDLKRSAIEIIHLMFQRWLQENDFKYLDKHFGINQVTSYRSIEYAKLKGQVEDREVKSAARKALDLKLKQVTEPLKRQLLAEEQAHQAHQLRTVKGPEVAAKLALESSSGTPAYKELRRQAVALKAADLRYETTRLERRKSIEQGHKEIAAIQVQIAGTKAQESRLDVMIQAQMVKMDGQCKRLMDVLKITARNLFYQALQPFKKAYDNYRDDHDYFRKLTQCPGVIEVRAQEIVVHLMPPTQDGGELRKAVLQTLDGTNALGLEHPCLPGRKLKFRLGQRSEMELKMNVEA